eukprot:Skav200020  [mRNA]  locus=scaffold2535:98399:101426:- [translate_table: standard]
MDGLRPQVGHLELRIQLYEGFTEMDLREEVEGQWPDLQHQEWHYRPLHPAHQASGLTEDDVPQFVIFDYHQAPPGSPWIATVIEVESVDATGQPAQHFLLPLIVAVPMRKFDLLRQLQLEDLRMQTFTAVNGRALRSADQPRIFRHGSFLTVSVDEADDESDDADAEEFDQPPSEDSYDYEGEEESADAALDGFDTSSQDQHARQAQLSDEAAEHRTEPRDQVVHSTVCYDVPIMASHGSWTTLHSQPALDQPVGQPANFSQKQMSDVQRTAHSLDCCPALNPTQRPAQDLRAIARPLKQPRIALKLAEHLREDVKSGPSRTEVSVVSCPTPSFSTRSHLLPDAPDDPHLDVDDDDDDEAHVMLSQLAPRTGAALRVPQPILLDALIPQHDPEPHRLRLRSALCHHDLLFAQWPVDAVHTALPDNVEWHPATRHWLHRNMTANGPPDLCQRHILIIYTDGSYVPSLDTAAWAWAAFHPDDEDFQTLHLAAWHHGAVDLDPQSPTFFGASNASSAAAEASALQWATAFALQGEATTVYFRYDSVSIGGRFGGLSDYIADFELVHNVRKLAQCLEAVLGLHRVHYEHVPAHRGDPYNELVNSLAYHSAKGLLPVRHFNYDFRALLQDDALQDLWKPPTTGRLGMIPRLLTHNVQSLSGRRFGQDDAASFTGKLAYYRAQLHDHTIDIAGLQETRLAESQVYTSDGYCLVSAAAKQGHGGTALLFSINRSIASGKDSVLLDAQSLTVLHADPRQLLELTGELFEPAEMKQFGNRFFKIFPNQTGYVTPMPTGNMPTAD